MGFDFTKNLVTNFFVVSIKNIGFFANLL